MAGLVNVARIAPNSHCSPSRRSRSPRPTPAPRSLTRFRSRPTRPDESSIGAALAAQRSAAGTTLIVSQPQVDAWDGFTLAARFAVKATNAERTTYGIVTLDRAP